MCGAHLQSEDNQSDVKLGSIVRQSQNQQNHLAVISVRREEGWGNTHFSQTVLRILQALQLWLRLNSIKPHSTQMEPESSDPLINGSLIRQQPLGSTWWGEEMAQPSACPAYTECGPECGSPALT